MSRSRMFDDDPAHPSPRTTIVGGRPPEDGSHLPPVPTGIQRLLRLASVDEAFRGKLLAVRAEVAAKAGVELSASERAILAAIPSAQLERMAESLPPPPADRRVFLLQTAAAAVALLGGASLQACGGKQQPGDASAPETSAPRPADEPPTRPTSRPMDADGGAAPDEPPPRPQVPMAGVTVSPPPRPPRPQSTRGTRSDLP